MVGAYTTVNCTLRLLKNSIRINSLLTPQYEHSNEDGVRVDDERFIDHNISFKAIFVFPQPGAFCLQTDKGNYFWQLLNHWFVDLVYSALADEKHSEIHFTN